ncbi:tripartite tricarboxylate transporter TctB family protein [Halalkalibacter oceani]|uniref:tripartite tricarboxylate transporter TctB family protein n=1 Tax=Halalkalibacter oceani TaxID=1653776 RepID=UPI00339757E4
MAIANFIFIAIVVTISLLVLVTTKSFPMGDYTVGFGPGFFPVITAMIMLGLSLLLIIQTIRTKDKSLFNMNMKALKFPAILVGLLIIYSIMLEYVGFFLSTVMILTVTMIAFKTRLVKSLIISVVITALLYVGFKLVLKVPLPEGIVM